MFLKMQMFLKMHMFSTFTQMNIKTFSALFIRALSGLQELVDEQETQNLTQHSAAPRAVLNFLFLVRELVLVNPDNALQDRCNP